MRMIFTLLILTLVSLITPLITPTQVMANKGLTAANREYTGFLEFRPSDHSGTAKHPLIIFLDGIGEKGNGTAELNNVKYCGIPAYIKNGSPMRFTWMGKTESFVVSSPTLSPILMPDRQKPMTLLREPIYSD